MKIFVYTIFLLLFPLFVQAQTYHSVTHLSGSQQVGLNVVTVVPLAGPISSSYCGIGPYQIGNGNMQNGYLFKFALPVTRLRVELANIGDDEFFGIQVNGVFYPVNQAEVSPTSCGPVANVSNGYITNTLIGSNKFARIDIHPGYFIDSAEVYFVSGTKFGANCSFSFATDPHVYVAKPFADTLLCIGDSVQINYLLSDVFNTANEFSIQMSDANGNFANGTIIGSVHDTLPGKVYCGIPANTPPGDNYHYRVIASIPADTSAVNPERIRISAYPVITASANGPVCEGETVQLHAEVDTTNTYINWAGPSGFNSTSLNPSFVSELKHTGVYSITANRYTCISSAKVSVIVKPVPSITSVTNNSPMCEGETLRLNATASDTGLIYNWTGPGFTSAVQSPVIISTPYDANGMYTVSGVLNGCSSLPDSTEVVIYPRPAKPQVTTNAPLSPGEDLQFNSITSPDVTYNWTGPNNFSSQEANPVIKQVDVYAEGDYTVTVTLGICTAATTVNVDVLQNHLYYHVLPNPNNGNFTIKGNHSVDSVIPVEIVNSMGQVVYKADLSTTNKFLDVDIDLGNRLSAGIYLLRIKLKDEILTARFTVSE